VERNSIPQKTVFGINRGIIMAYYTIVLGRYKPLVNNKNELYMFTSELSAWTALSRVKREVEDTMDHDLANTLKVIPIELCLAGGD
jgi:hypothetical protein